MNAPISRTKLSARDLAKESLAGVSQRPSRTVLTMLGTVLGIGAFVAVLGLTATASGQISSTFSELKATQVTVTDAGETDAKDTVYSFPDNADAHISALNGVVTAGRSWPIPGIGSSVSTTLDPRSPHVQMTVNAASPGYLNAVQPTMKSGALYNAFHENNALHVVVLGAGAARQLRISSADEQPTVFISDTAYTVVGIMSDVKREPAALSALFIPATTALIAHGEPTTISPATMLIETTLGAAPLIATQAATALRPDKPDLLRATPPHDTSTLENTVTGSLNSLFLILASVTLFIGAIGIANTTLVAVMERTPEIGLRRAIGARPRDIAVQFLTETAAIGTLGGLIGTTLGIAIVLTTAIVQSSTAIIDPWLTLPAPLIGTLVGLLAGLYPAHRAARVQPVDALRR